jgi:hypothetical protein
MSYSDASLLFIFFRCFILLQQGTCFYVWLWYKRERISKHSAIWLILGGYAPSYKSNSLAFRCSSYYLYNVSCLYFVSNDSQTMVMIGNLISWRRRVSCLSLFILVVRLCINKKNIYLLIVFVILLQFHTLATNYCDIYFCDVIDALNPIVIIYISTRPSADLKLIHIGSETKSPGNLCKTKITFFPVQLKLRMFGFTNPKYRHTHMPQVSDPGPKGPLVYLLIYLLIFGLY